MLPLIFPCINSLFRDRSFSSSDSALYGTEAASSPSLTYFRSSSGCSRQPWCFLLQASVLVRYFLVLLACNCSMFASRKSHCSWLVDFLNEAEQIWVLHRCRGRDHSPPGYHYPKMNTWTLRASSSSRVISEYHISTSNCRHLSEWRLSPPPIQVIPWVWFARPLSWLMMRLLVSWRISLFWRPSLLCCLHLGLSISVPLIHFLIISGLLLQVWSHESRSCACSRTYTSNHVILFWVGACAASVVCRTPAFLPSQTISAQWHAHWSSALDFHRSWPWAPWSPSTLPFSSVWARHFPWEVQQFWKSFDQ